MSRGRISLRGRLEGWLQQQWYGRSDVHPALAILEPLFASAVQLRNAAYRRGMAASRRFEVPVIVVGNLTVGGAGKTPLVQWIANHLAGAGYRPGIVSRGYGGSGVVGPRQVEAGSDPWLVGDEPVLLAARTGLPLYVDPERCRAVEALLSHHDCSVVVADDGLQHNALQRDVEIVVVDGDRRFGNGHLLPAGPLREPLARLASVSLVVCNGGTPGVGEWGMSLVAGKAIHLVTGQVRELAAFAAERVVAVAGIGNPGRFFRLLRGAGLEFEERPFPDHHRFRREDLAGGGRIVLMTEKDAVKCRGLALPSGWYVPVEARLAPEFGQRLIQLIRR